MGFDKDGEPLEQACKIKAVVFDKTELLQEGNQQSRILWQWRELKKIRFWKFPQAWNKIRTFLAEAICRYAETKGTKSKRQ